MQIKPVTVHLGIVPAMIVATSLLSSCTQQAAQEVPKVSISPLPPAALSFDYTTVFQVPRGAPSADPDLCLKSTAIDPADNSIGGYSTLAAYTFASRPTVQNLYAKLVYDTEICTADSLSGSDQTLFQKILNFFGVADARSFAATLVVTGNSQGVAYPTFIPFQYAFDKKKHAYSVSAISKGALPWQATIGSNTFDIQYSYTANKNLSIDTADLFSSLVTAVSGAGKSALLSQASNAYLNASQLVLKRVGDTFFTEITSAKNVYRFDMLQDSTRAVHGTNSLSKYLIPNY